MRVKAIRNGYDSQALIRRNEGEVFEMADKVFSVKGKDGKVVHPSWVERADGQRETKPKGTIQTGIEKSTTVVPDAAAAPASEQAGDDVI